MKRIMLCALLTGIVSSAAIAAPPADCSKGPVPAGPVAGFIGGYKFTPKENTLAVTGSMSENDAKFDVYTLTFNQPTGEAESSGISVQFLVKTGTLPDGRSYRAVPGSVGAQPKAGGTSFAEVQSWHMNDDAANVDVDFTQTFTGSLQVTFGKRAGGKIPGSIYICAPDGKPSWMGGGFVADLNPR